MARRVALSERSRASAWSQDPATSEGRSRGTERPPTSFHAGLSRWPVQLAPWVMLSLPLLFLMVFLLAPVLLSIVLSLTNNGIEVPVTHFVGLANYREILQDSSVGAAAFHTLIYAAGVTLLSTVLGLALASALNSRFVVWRVVFRTLIYTPVLVSVSVSSLVWLWIYNPQSGPLNSVLEAFGLPPEQWLQSPALALPCLIAMGVWTQTGFAMLLYLGGLQGVPPELREAARVDGASEAQVVRKVVIPLLRPITTFVVMISAVQTVQVFSRVDIMTQGGPLSATTTLVYLIYQDGLVDGNIGYALALSFVVFIALVLLGAIALPFRLRNGWGVAGAR